MFILQNIRNKIHNFYATNHALQTMENSRALKGLDKQRERPARSSERGGPNPSLDTPTHARTSPTLSHSSLISREANIHTNNVHRAHTQTDSLTACSQS